jgi:hypothetical protein
VVEPAHQAAGQAAEKLSLRDVVKKFRLWNNERLLLEALKRAGAEAGAEESMVQQYLVALVVRGARCYVVGWWDGGGSKLLNEPVNP